LESCEQFYDKEQFIQQVYRVLKPGGKLMLATWCSDQEYYEGKKAKDYLTLCKAFCVPYMPTISYYSYTLEKYFKILLVQDWSENVKQSWSIGMAKLKNYSLLELLKLCGIKGIFLVKKLSLLQRAFEETKIRYGVFIAEKK
jgi:tocopherol O-methyltransferase